MNKNYYMQQALSLSFSRMSYTSPNPPVGAVLVKNNRIISRGGTQFCGGDHAEVCAINQAGEDTNGAELYVTLEPCCHHGKTPPCTDAIINAGIKSVYISSIDPNPKVCGKGIDILRNSGINVFHLKEFQKQSDRILKPFFYNILKKRPMFIHKGAMTLDGYTSTLNGDSKWITNAKSRLIVHRLRSIVDAIIIGKNTYEHDNPSLNCRIDNFKDNLNVENNNEDIMLNNLLSNDFLHEKKNPLRILLGLPKHISSDHNFFYDENYLIFIDDKKYNHLEERSDYKFISKLYKNEKIVHYNCDSYLEQVDFISNFLYKRGILLAMVEGGSRVVGSFYDSKLIDEVFIFVAPKILGNGLPLITGKNKETMSDAIVLRSTGCISIENDLLYHGIINE